MKLKFLFWSKNFVFEVVSNSHAENVVFFEFVFLFLLNGKGSCHVI